MRRALLIGCAAFTLAACGGGNEEERTATTNTPRPQATSDAPTSAPSPTPSAEVASARCLPIPVENMQEVIATGVEDGVGQMTFTDAAAVKSEDFQELYMVAGRFTVPGVDGEVGVWATNSIDPIGGGLIMAVDGLAQQFTVWPDGDSTDANVKSTDDGAAEARACLGDG